jgi:thiol-disulfide isomerase/thioredoxin
MNRRLLLTGGVAATAGAAGWGLALWHAAQFEEATGGLWNMRFPQPDQGELVMSKHLGRPLVLNFWATWCPPCVKELPTLDRFQREYASRGWQVVGLAVDGPTPVREFLARMPLAIGIGLAGFEGTDLSRRLGNTRGALPFTAVFDGKGRIMQRKLGETNFDELTRWANAL